MLAELLALRPQFIDAVDCERNTALHCAAAQDHENVVALLLAREPSLIDAINDSGRTALFHAAHSQCERVLEYLLAIKPEQAFMRDFEGNTLLHAVLWSARYDSYERREWKFCSETLMKKVWETNKGALQQVNNQKETPFELAMRRANRTAHELFKWQVTIDEHVNNSLETVRPFVEQQCTCLLATLGQDVMGIIVDYLPTCFRYN